MKAFFELLSEIVSLLETFATETGDKDVSLEKFILWLNREALFRDEVKSYRYMDHTEHGPDEHGKSSPHAPGQVQEKDHASPANVHLTLLLNMLSKHFKIYSKKVLLDSDLVSMDGHTFLAALCDTDSMRKMELIRANFAETPSGIEVINRLLKKGFIEEFDDPDDKRSKRVRVTAKGRREFEATLPPLRKVIKIMGGKLSKEKMVQLISLLDELNAFHVALHPEARNLTLVELLERL